MDHSLIQLCFVLQSKIRDATDQQQKILIQTLYQYMSKGILRNWRVEFALHLVHKMYPNHITDEVCIFLAATKKG